MTEDWEQCFLPLDHPECIPPPGISRCDHCCGTIPHGVVIRACFQLGGLLYDYDYCTADCKVEHRITLIRESGL